MQSASYTVKKVHRAKHRWVLQLGKPAGNQHMDPHAATLQGSGWLCCPPRPWVPQRDSPVATAVPMASSPELLKGFQIDVAFWLWLYSYLKSHSFGRETHNLGRLAVPIPHLPLHPALQHRANPCGGVEEQVAAI